MRRLRWVCVAIAIAFTATACAASPQDPRPRVAPDASHVATAAVFLGDVPYAFRVPAGLVDRVRSVTINDEWVAELAPLTATQLNFVAADGQEVFLANVFWFAADRFNALLKPDTPPPGLALQRTADRVLAVAATVEMPFDPVSADGEAYGRLATLARDADAFTPLGRCPTATTATTRELSDAVQQVVIEYYTAKDLDPVVFPEELETVLDLERERVGTHACVHPDGGVEGWVGVVPADAVAAVRVFVRHEPYAVTQTPANFVTLAQERDGAWTVVGEATSP